MISDEEKKAIEDLKRHIIPFKLNDTLLDLIEKQQKEIEELKRKEQLIKTYKGNLPEDIEFICLCKSDFERNISDDYISKDKIKAKIEELERGNKNTFIRGEKILVLQSLLEKEVN